MVINLMIKIFGITENKDIYNTNIYKQQMYNEANFYLYSQKHDNGSIIMEFIYYNIYIRT